MSENSPKCGSSREKVAQLHADSCGCLLAGTGTKIEELCSAVGRLPPTGLQIPIHVHFILGTTAQNYWRLNGVFSPRPRFSGLHLRTNSSVNSQSACLKTKRKLIALVRLRPHHVKNISWRSRKYIHSKVTRISPTLYKDFLFRKCFIVNIHNQNKIKYYTLQRHKAVIQYRLASI